MQSIFSIAILCILVLTGARSELSAEIKIVPVGNLQLTGGQAFLKNEATSFGSNLNIFFAPVINFSANTALLPMYSGVYRGTKDVQELVGGGTLTREYLDNSLSLKFVNRFSENLKGKIRGGYKIEYLKETKDEEWTKGLFDYNKTIVGLEVEKIFPDATVNLRAGYDYYKMAYPNYATLISKNQYQTSIDTTTYKEVSANAGVNVLDYDTHEIFIEAVKGFSDSFTGKFLYDLSLKNFADQHLIDEAGAFSTTLRKDTIHLVGFTLQTSAHRAVLSVADSIQYYTSNQNSYDAGRTQFIPNFYNFVQNSVAPSVLFYLGRKQPYGRLNFWWEITHRKYQDRIAQKDDGTYTAEKIYQATNTLGFALSYPLGIMKGLSARVSANYRDASSNMKYEKYYKYNYYITNYFAGIEWEM
ncbi:MAG: hypothetical protein ABIJ11_01610 [Elusimicrobiota bacterium]